METEERQHKGRGHEMLRSNIKAHNMFIERSQYMRDFVYVGQIRSLSVWRRGRYSQNQ